MNDNVKRWSCIALIGVFLCALQFFFAGGKEVILEILSRNFDVSKEQPVVVLDAGHGGFDPGKVGVNGADEKDINLAIALELKDLLEQNDITVVMTRTEDCGLYSESDTNKKTADLRARIELIAETAPVLAVSIHQNSFTESSSWGTQVFYYKDSKEGEIIANTLQEAIRRELADGNHCVAKPNSNYFMLKKSTCPLVIVECGFLSNPEEAERLVTEDYQRKMAWAIHLGIMEWLSGQN